MAKIDYDAWDTEYDAIVNGERDNMWGMQGVPDIPVATETVFGDKWHEGNGKKYILPGERVRVEIPHSVVAEHLDIIGQQMEVELRDGVFPFATVYRDGKPYFEALSTAEAGMEQDQYGFYVYEVK